MTRLPLRLLAGAAAVLATLSITGCGDQTPTPQEENLSDLGTTPQGLDGADTSGNFEDSLRYENSTQGGGTSPTDRLGTGAGSISQSGAVEGGTQNPDVRAPQE